MKMKNSIVAFLLLLFSLPMAAQEKVALYDEMCDPLQSVFCDFVKKHSKTSYISNVTGEYVGTIIDLKFCGWGMFFSMSGVHSYGQYYDGKLLFGLLLNDEVARVGSDEHHVMYDLSTGEIIRLRTKEGDVPLEFPLVASSDGEPSPYAFRKEACKNGDIYVGEFYNGRRNGYGVCHLANGDVWYGYYRDGYRDGYGMLLKPDHRIQYGKWVGDTKVE